MTDQEIRRLIEAGVDRSEIEYIMMHSEIGEEFQDQLLELLAAGDFAKYHNYLDEMMQWNIWDDSKDGDGTLPLEEEEKINELLNYLMTLTEPPKELPIQMQYLNLTYVMRHMFYNKDDVLSVLTPDQGNTVKFQTDRGEKWEVFYDTDSLLTVDKRLDPFDFNVLDAIFTLHTNEINFFSTRWLDMILSGSGKRSTTKGSIDRIDHSIEKLSYLNIQITINGKERAYSRLLSVQRFGNTEGSYYYLNELNDFYMYAVEMGQVANTPATYFDTSALPKEYKFSDTETAILIKRRVIARVMGILRQSEAKHHVRKNWNRISLIHSKDKKHINQKGRQKNREADVVEYPHTKRNGLFGELGLLPDVDGLTPAEQKEVMSKWRKPKADYMRVVRGTLEHLKRIYVILDYEEVRPNESKSLRDPVIGYDIICFTQTEINALNGMREELKASWVQKKLDKRHSTQSKKTADTNTKNGGHEHKK